MERIQRPKFSRQWLGGAVKYVVIIRRTDSGLVLNR